MARVSSGPSPWSDGYKRANASSGYHYAYTRSNDGRLSGGWVQTEKDEWNRVPSTEMREVILSNGRKVKVPIVDAKWFAGHAAERNNPGYNSNEAYRYDAEWADDTFDTDMVKYVETAFETKNGSYVHKVYAVDGVGHIKKLEYSVYKQLMQVTFCNDTICAYFRVPAAVFGELMSLAQSGATAPGTRPNVGIGPSQYARKRGGYDRERHLLGIRFWDLIRIRGTIHGGRYRFMYMVESAPQSVASTDKVYRPEDIAVQQAHPGISSKNDLIEQTLKEYFDEDPEQLEIIEDIIATDYPDYLGKFKAQDTLYGKIKIARQAGVRDLDDAALGIDDKTMSSGTSLDDMTRMQYERINEFKRNIEAEKRRKARDHENDAKVIDGIAAARSARSIDKTDVYESFSDRYDPKTVARKRNDRAKREAQKAATAPVVNEQKVQEGIKRTSAVLKSAGQKRRERNAITRQNKMVFDAGLIDKDAYDKMTVAERKIALREARAKLEVNAKKNGNSNLKVIVHKKQ